MSNKKILWITPKWPFPATDGARQATLSLLKALTQIGEKIDLLSFSDSEINHEEKQTLVSDLNLQNVFSIKKNYKFGKLTRTINLIKSTLIPSSLPFTVMPFEIELEKLPLEIKNNNYTHVVFDGLHCAASFLDDNKKFFKNAKFIYRAHNLETNLWVQTLSKAKLLLRYPLEIQLNKIRNFEERLISISQAVATVSDSDLTKFRESFKLPKSKTIPIGLDFNKPPTKLTSDLNLLFVGSLSWRANNQGIKWFLDEVWTKITREINLNVVGKGTENLKNLYPQLQRVNFLGEVKNLDSLYENASATIVPIFTGSGTRVKAIEAARYGRACISTSLGIEGLPFRDKHSYFQAESKEDWIKIISEIQASELSSVGLSAHQILREQFDYLACGKLMQELLESC